MYLSARICCESRDGRDDAIADVEVDLMLMLIVLVLVSSFLLELQWIIVGSL